MGTIQWNGALYDIQFFCGDEAVHPAVLRRDLLQNERQEEGNRKYELQK